MLARSKLNSIENKIFKEWIDNEISHEDFENWKKALEWRIVIEVMLKKLVWLEKVRKWSVNEVIRSNEIINNSLEYKYV